MNDSSFEQLTFPIIFLMNFTHFVLGEIPNFKYGATVTLPIYRQLWTMQSGSELENLSKTSDKFR